MEIIKKNLISVICGVVALLAIIALFIPLGGFYKTLQQDLDTYKVNYGKAETLLKGTRYLPVIETGSKVEREKLASFPSPKAIAAGKLATDQVRIVSGKLLEQAVALNRRELMFPGILPNPGDKIFDFRKTYLEAVQGGLPKFLGSAIPPTPDEIDEQAKELHDNEFEKRVIKVGGKEFNREDIERDFKLAAAQLPEKLRQERALKYKLYMDRAAMSINPTMLDSGKKPTASDVWFSQLTYWVEADVAASIAAANERGGGADKNVVSDPVKRLVKLEIPQDASAYVLDSAAGAQPAKGAIPVADQGGATRDFARSPSGRVCNSLFDVVHFNLVLDVDQRRIPMILQELERGKLLTVNQVDLTPVDSGARFQEGYVYGNAPVVEITLQCEALMMRAWTKELMPDEIKMLLGVIQPPAKG